MQLSQSEERAGCSTWSLTVTLVLFFPSTQPLVHSQGRPQWTKAWLFPNHKYANPHLLKEGDLLANQSSGITAFVSHLYGD